MSIMVLDILAFDNRNKESAQEEYALRSYLQPIENYLPSISQPGVHTQ